MPIRTKHLAKLLQRLQHTIRRLVEHHRALFINKALQLGLASLLLRQETLKAETVTWKATAYQGWDKGCSTWQRLNLDTSLNRLTNQEEPWVRDAWGTCITD